MSDRPSYNRWVGVLLGILIDGSAHFLCGRRAAGLKWYLGLYACGIVAIAMLALPGGSTLYILGLALVFVRAVLWFVMLRQSYRSVPRQGFLGWLAVVVLAVVLGSAQSSLVRQCVLPFKVPTGAMQPTLCGVHWCDVPADSSDRPGFFRWILTGNRVHEVKTSTGGILSAPHWPPDAPSKRTTYMVGDRLYHIPSFARPLKQPGEYVPVGETIWSGVITSGDHLFAERLSYRFGKPKRGDVVVFRTDGIEALPHGSFFIKRVAGLPGERIRIEPPDLIVNDRKVTQPDIFNTISGAANGYAGFQLARRSLSGEGVLSESTNTVVLGSNEYFVLGDNTRESADSRYWGPVPEKNIIGKATRVYWPFTRINALEGVRNKSD